MDTYSLTKTKVECYKFRNKSGDWSDIVIDASGETGRIQIATDFDSYQYYWGACGRPFKEFLTSLSIDYVAGKFGCAQYFDIESTITTYREQARECFRKDDITKKKDTMNEIVSLSDCTDEIHFVMHLQTDCPNIMGMYDGMPEMCRCIAPNFKRFWTEIWYLFIEELKNEINPCST